MPLPGIGVIFMIFYQILLIATEIFAAILALL